MEFPQSRHAAARAGFAELRHVSVTGSTNTDLVDEALAGSSHQKVLVADHQTAGRGRLDRHWVDSGGALLVSFRLAADPRRAQQLMAATSAAVRIVAARHMATPVLVKWPNDLVVVDDGIARKLAGLLAEWVDGADPAVVIGVGLNMVPIDSVEDSAAIAQFGSERSRDQVLAEILDALSERFDTPDQVREEIRVNSATLGTRVRIELPGGARLIGLASAFDDDGRLVLVSDDGKSHVITTGDVVHSRPDD